MSINQILQSLRFLGVEDHQIEQMIRRRVFSETPPTFTQEEIKFLESRLNLNAESQSGSVAAIKPLNSSERDVIGEANFLELLHLRNTVYMVISLSKRNNTVQVEKCTFDAEEGNESPLKTIRSWII